MHILYLHRRPKQPLKVKQAHVTLLVCICAVIVHFGHFYVWSLLILLKWSTTLVHIFCKSAAPSLLFCFSITGMPHIHTSNLHSPITYINKMTMTVNHGLINTNYYVTVIAINLHSFIHSCVIRCGSISDTCQ